MNFAAKLKFNISIFNAVIVFLKNLLCKAGVDLKIWTSRESPNYVSPFLSKDNLTQRFEITTLLNDIFTFPSQGTSSSPPLWKRVSWCFWKLLLINNFISLKSSSQLSAVTSWQSGKGLQIFSIFQDTLQRTTHPHLSRKESFIMFLQLLLINLFVSLVSISGLSRAGPARGKGLKCQQFFTGWGEDTEWVMTYPQILQVVFLRLKVHFKSGA